MNTNSTIPKSIYVSDFFEQYNPDIDYSVSKQILIEIDQNIISLINIFFKVSGEIIVGNDSKFNIKGNPPETMVYFNQNTLITLGQSINNKVLVCYKIIMLKRSSLILDKIKQISINVNGPYSNIFSQPLYMGGKYMTYCLSMYEILDRHDAHIDLNLDFESQNYNFNDGNYMHYLAGRFERQVQIIAGDLLDHEI